MHNTLVQLSRCTGSCIMQIRNSVVYDASKDSLYKYCNKRYILWQRCDNANSHYLCISRPTYRSGKLCDGSSHVHNTLVQRTRCTGSCTLLIRNPVVYDASKGCLYKK